MSKRFALTAAGAAAAAVGGSASAEIISFTIHNDYYIGENSWTISDSASNIIASMFVSNGSLFVGTSQSSTYGVDFGLWDSSATSPLDNGYRTTFQMDLGAGDYTVRMGDTWGDGWVWNSVNGLDAFAVAGNLAGGNQTFSMVSTSATVDTFTVVPAPGALALLGLAGIAGRRKRG